MKELKEIDAEIWPVCILLMDYVASTASLCLRKEYSDENKPYRVNKDKQGYIEINKTTDPKYKVTLRLLHDWNAWTRMATTVALSDV